MIELMFPVTTPSANRLWGHHWSKKAKERRNWGWRVRAERLRLKSFHVEPIKLPLQMTIERYGPRLLDVDNFVFGCKPLLDALVAEGFLVGDSPAELSATYRQHVGKPYRTVVTIGSDAAKSLNSV